MAKIKKTITPNKYFINGRWWDEVNITIQIDGQIIKGIVPVKYKSNGKKKN